MYVVLFLSVWQYVPLCVYYVCVISKRLTAEELKHYIGICVFFYKKSLPMRIQLTLHCMLVSTKQKTGKGRRSLSSPHTTMTVSCSNCYNTRHSIYLTYSEKGVRLYLRLMGYWLYLSKRSQIEHCVLLQLINQECIYKLYQHLIFVIEC